jgi:hypothetical protein
VDGDGAVAQVDQAAAFEVLENLVQGRPPHAEHRGQDLLGQGDGAILCLVAQQYGRLFGERTAQQAGQAQLAGRLTLRDRGQPPAGDGRPLGQ